MLLVRPCNSIFVFTAISRPPFCVLRYRRFPVNYMPPPSSFPSSSRSEREDNSRYYTVLSNNNRLFNPTSIRRIYNTTLRVLKEGSRRWMDFFFVTKKELIPKFVTRGRLHRKKKRKKKKNPSSFDEGISFRKVKGRDDTLETRTLEICTMRAASSSRWTFYGVIRRQGSLVRGWRTRRGLGSSVARSYWFPRVGPRYWRRRDEKRGVYIRRVSSQFPSKSLALTEGIRGESKFLHSFEKIPFLNYSRPFSSLSFSLSFEGKKKDRKDLSRFEKILKSSKVGLCSFLKSSISRLKSETRERSGEWSSPWRISGRSFSPNGIKIHPESNGENYLPRSRRTRLPVEHFARWNRGEKRKGEKEKERERGWRKTEKVGGGFERRERGREERGAILAFYPFMNSRTTPTGLLRVMRLCKSWVKRDRNYAWRRAAAIKVYRNCSF